MEAMQMDEVAEKLQNLEEHMPDASDILIAFGKFLAGRLRDHELVPEGFTMAVALAAYDLRKGVDGFTGDPIDNELVGQPSYVYSILEMSAVDLARAVCPPEFTAGVEQMMKSIAKDMLKDVELKDTEPHVFSTYEENEESFIANVIQQIIEHHELPFQFTKIGWLTLSLVADGNPAKANLIFRHLIQEYPGKTLFTDIDVTETFPFGVDKKEFITWWDTTKALREAGGEDEYEFYRMLTMSGIRLYFARLRWWIKNSLAKRRLSQVSAR